MDAKCFNSNSVTMVVPMKSKNENFLSSASCRPSLSALFHGLLLLIFELYISSYPFTIPFFGLLSHATASGLQSLDFEVWIPDGRFVQAYAMCFY